MKAADLYLWNKNPYFSRGLLKEHPAKGRERLVLREDYAFSSLLTGS